MWTLEAAKMSGIALQPDHSYTASQISDLCRGQKASFLRMKLTAQKGTLREKLHYISTRLPPGDYCLIGMPQKSGENQCGYLQKTALKEGTYSDIKFDDELDISAKSCGDMHPLEEIYKDITLLYFMCDTFEKEHLVRSGLLRKRNLGQKAKLMGVPMKSGGRVAKKKKGKKDGSSVASKVPSSPSRTPSEEQEEPQNHVAKVVKFGTAKSVLPSSVPSEGSDEKESDEMTDEQEAKASVKESGVGVAGGRIEKTKTKTKAKKDRSFVTPKKASAKVKKERSSDTPKKASAPSPAPSVRSEDKKASEKESKKEAKGSAKKSRTRKSAERRASQKVV